MLTIDPPWHTRYRATVAGYFTPRPIAALRPAVVAIVDRLVDTWIGEGHIEFVERFAIPLPIEAIAYVLNVPPDRMAGAAGRDGMPSCVTVRVVVITGVPPAPESRWRRRWRWRTGSATRRRRPAGLMMLNVWLPPSCTLPRLMLVGGMWHWMHLPLWTLGNADTSMAP